MLGWHERNGATLDWVEWDAREECLQRAAWRCVRAAEDIHGAIGRGAEKRAWAVARLVAAYDGVDADAAEVFVRAAYVQYLTERAMTMES